MSFDLKQFRGTPVLYSDGRVQDSDYTKYGFHKYELRHGDDGDWITPVTVEDRVLVNFAGTILSIDKLHLDQQNWNGSYFADISEEERNQVYECNVYGGFEDFIVDFGGIQPVVTLGIPTVTLDERDYEVRIFHPDDEFVEGYAYLFNNYLLPYRGPIQMYVGRELVPGIYEYFEKVLVIPPNEGILDDEDYTLDLLREWNKGGN